MFEDNGITKSSLSKQRLNKHIDFMKNIETSKL